MKRSFRSALTLVALAFTMLPTAHAAEPVDLLLVLAADVSRSIDQPKFQLQREGYAAAISHPRVLAAITSGPNRRIAMCFVEWSGLGAQKVMVDWTLIDDAAAARRFGDQLLEASRSYADRTSISGAIDFAVTLFDHVSYESTRRVVDVSGDGDNNAGRDVTAARDEAVAKGITINGLVILTENPPPWSSGHTHPPGGLEAYYRNNVIGGPGAFVIAAENFDAFGKAIIAKMVAEIVGLPPRRQARKSR
jgi:hypothetical protein